MGKISDNFSEVVAVVLVVLLVAALILGPTIARVALMGWDWRCAFAECRIVK